MAAVQVRPDREDDIARDALGRVRDVLPRGWDLEIDRATGGPAGADFIATVRSPAGERVVLVIEAKRTLVTREMEHMVSQLEAWMSAAYPGAGRNREAVPMVVARFLSQPLQTWLTEREVAYADATGNLRLSLDRPALFVRDVGQSKDPWRGPGRPKGNLAGEPAARVVRALTDCAPPYSVPQLIDLSGASSGATYRVVDFLEDETLIERTPRGQIETVRWRALLERWAQDYTFTQNNAVTTHLAPRGLGDVMARLAGLSDDGGKPGPLRYAVTGSLATRRWREYAPARNAMIYTDDPDALAMALDLRPVDTGANVALARPTYDVVYARRAILDGVAVAAPTQVAVDLATGPGRNPAEGQALLDWMEGHERAWRR